MLMYFESRGHAGIQLAAELLPNYRYENCAVVALSDGAVLVGEQIAAQLHCILTLLLIENIEVPGESISFGGVSEGGGFTYNGMFSAGEIEEYTTEFHGYLEEQKRQAFQKINRLLGDGGLINHEMLRDHVVILVADGLDNGAAIDVAVDFLKPVRIAKLVVVSPVASVQAVDKLHMLADELHILDVKENYLSTDHYFGNNVIPPHEETIAKINKIVLNWR
jgi:putative phosphoribosyl transferase